MNPFKTIPAAVAASKPLQTFLIVGAIVLIIWWTGRSMGREKAEKELDEKFKLKKLPDGGASIPRQWEEGQAKALVEELADVVSGVFDTNDRKELVYAKLLTLTNDQLTFCYNLYNRLFGADDKETMTGAVKGEWAPLWGGRQRSALISRLAQLGLP